ncbi:MAG: carboxypeptidase regulatory-like domain-containing protein [Pyrinomonadaceae bacterium]
MKRVIYGLCFSFLVLFANSLPAFPESSNLLNRIEGQVYDPNQRPVQNLYVELLNEVDSVIQRTKTNASGRFSFVGVPPGRLTVRVLTFGTNFMEQTQEVIIVKTRNNNDVDYVDINLRYETRSRGSETDLSLGVIFVQDIPPAARASYLKGVADFGKDQEKGLLEIEEAVKIFPSYFDALNWLGKEYVSRRNYDKAYPYLLRAIDVNQRSAPTYYSLSYAFYQMKQYPAALEAARATTLLAPASVDAQLLYGTILRITASYSEAETVLLKANSLAKEMNPEAHWQLSLLYNRLNRNQDTINELEAFLKLVPDSPDKNKIRDMIAKLRTSIDKNK